MPEISKVTITITYDDASVRRVTINSEDLSWELEQEIKAALGEVPEWGWAEGIGV